MLQPAASAAGARSALVASLAPNEHVADDTAPIIAIEANQLDDAVSCATLAPAAERAEISEIGLADCEDPNALDPSRLEHGREEKPPGRQN